MNTPYALGTSYPPTPLHLFSPPLPPPMISEPVLYPVTFDRGDSSVAGHGFPKTTWIFQVLTETEKRALAAICTVGGVERKSRTNVYICTRTPQDLDTFGYYLVTMILPDWKDFRQVTGLYFNVPVEFRKLVEYTP